MIAFISFKYNFFGSTLIIVDKMREKETHARKTRTQGTLNEVNSFETKVIKKKIMVSNLVLLNR